jgi:hypothetical protein
VGTQRGRELLEVAALDLKARRGAMAAVAQQQARARRKASEQVETLDAAPRPLPRLTRE